MSESDQYVIYRPAKTAMQSGKKQTKYWILKKINNENHRSINPLMGWTTSNNSKNQILLKFISKEQAINFAKQQNYNFTIIENQENKENIKPKSYANNFL